MYIYNGVMVIYKLLNLNYQILLKIIQTM